MNILLIGSGGREHTIAKALSASKKLDKLYCIPGNAGIEELAICYNKDTSDKKEILEFCIKNQIELVFIGPEIPLVEGLADYLNENKVFAFGPSKIASQLEGSKSYTKDLCKKYNIPTAKYEKFRDEIKATEYIKDHPYPLVIKVDGLAAGKGVIIAENKTQALTSLKDIFSGKFGLAGNEVVIEEFLEGEEASFFVISDGKNFIPLTSAQDHKRIGEGDTGLNTGGMGAYSPAPVMTKELIKKTIKNIIEPTLTAMKDSGSPYVGILYAGLMINEGEPKLIEYNVRFGDPECQVIIPRLKNDLIDLLINVKNQNLDNYLVNWIDNYAITIVLSSSGYPEDYKTGFKIEGIEKIKNNDKVEIYHAGTKRDGENIVTSGGRVLNINGYGDSLKLAKENAFSVISEINWPGCYYRKDIGWRALKD